MKLLQVMAGAEYGGAEEFFVRLAIALNSSEIQQKVLIRRNKFRADQLKEGGIEPVEFWFGGALDPFTRWGLRRQIFEFRPDIVLTWMNRATKIVPSGREFVHVGRLGGYYNLKYYRNCDHLIANTKDIAHYLKKNGWSDENVHYLPNFVSEKSDNHIKRKDFYGSDEGTLVLALGRLHENKAFDILLEALTKVPNTVLWVAGEGPLRKKLENQAARLGIMDRVRFLGWRRDKETLFAAADILVCPSRHEPLGNVIIEAWAQGVPVVAADSIGPKSLILDGETGLLFPVDNAKALTNALNRLISDNELRQSLINNGKKSYKSNFSEKLVVDKYLNLFKKICL